MPFYFSNLILQFALNKMTNSSTEIKEEQINEKVRPEEAK